MHHHPRMNGHSGDGTPRFALAADAAYLWVSIFLTNSRDTSPSSLSTFVLRPSRSDPRCVWSKLLIPYSVGRFAHRQTQRHTAVNSSFTPLLPFHCCTPTALGRLYADQHKRGTPELVLTQIPARFFRRRTGTGSKLDITTQGHSRRGHRSPSLVRLTAGVTFALCLRAALCLAPPRSAPLTSIPRPAGVRVSCAPDPNALGTRLVNRRHVRQLRNVPAADAGRRTASDQVRHLPSSPTSYPNSELPAGAPPVLVVSEMATRREDRMRAYAEVLESSPSYRLRPPTRALLVTLPHTDTHTL
ncbi:hypothetical protein B0H19DRAFT_1378069 [Mycena capillaripes]|nr:hypothetical protein B0H19DRAFT_1378069 [Mycena capillaripes]